MSTIFCSSLHANTCRQMYLPAIVLLVTIALYSGTASAVGFDQLGIELNGSQDAAADAIQGADIDGARPDIAPVAGRGLCQSIATNTDANNQPAPEFLANTAALGQRCAELVETADPGAVSLEADLDLGLSAQQVAEALQQIVPEETQVIGSGATDTAHDQMTNIGSRMQYLRTGTSLAAVSGISWSLGPQTGGAAGEGFSRLGVFINGDYGTGDKDATFNEDGFDFDAYGITAGIDYRFSDSFVAGLAVGFSNSEVEVDNNAGESDADGLNIMLYGTYFSDSFYVEASISSGSYDYETTRELSYGTAGSEAGVIQRTINGDTEGDQLAWSLGGGYTTSASSSALSLSFFGRLEGIDADIDAYNETMSATNGPAGVNDWAMRIEDQDIESLQAVLGLQMAYAFSQNWGVLQPYASIEAHHEFEDDARQITAFYLNDPFFAAGDRSFGVQLTSDEADEDFFLASVGTTFLFKGGTQMFLNYDGLLGLSDVSSHKLTLGVRFEF